MRSVGSVKSSFFVRKTIDHAAAFTVEHYPLKNSAILDSGTTIHIFNEISRFNNFRTADPGDFVWAGEHRVPIQGYGNVDIVIKVPPINNKQLTNVKKILRIHDVAYCQDFAANLVSLRQLHNMGIWWDNRPGHNYLRRTDFSIVAALEDQYDQFVLEYISSDLSRGAFHARRNKYNSWTKRAPVYGDAQKWHLRLGHPGPKALEHLVHCSTGARIRGLLTVQCDACGQSKIKRQIRRVPKDLHEGPGYRLAIDFHDFSPGRGGFNSLMLVNDRWSGHCWDYYLSNREAATIIAALKHLFGFLLRQCKIKPKIVEMDNELTTQKPKVRTFLEDEQHMVLEPSAPYTNSQIGGAERSGGVIKIKIRAMGIGANLPEYLWPEISRAAVYLHNRTPRYTYNWKSPHDRFFTHIAHQDGVVLEDRKPHQGHLKAYGCKAFAMTTDALTKKKRKQRLKPKAWIGYLVGYESSSIYRIWIPHLNKVIRTRDVIFNEDAIYEGKKETLDITLQELQDIANTIEEPESTTEDIPEPTSEFTYQNSQIAIPLFDSDMDEYEILDEDNEDENLDEAMRKAFENPEEFYPTPEATPPAALLAGAIRQPNDETNENYATGFQPWKASFYAGTQVQPSKTAAQRLPKRRRRIRTVSNNNKSINKARIRRILTQPNGLKQLHQRELPPEPEKHEDLDDHVLGEEFRKAERDHLQSHVPMNSWTEISKHDPEVKGHKVLDCMWVYVYKFDKHGRLAKCKARLVVRVDQQAKSTIGDTYAATLAARSFRVFMAIAARFDLEMIQYDAVNAFVHASLDEKIYMRMPKGYRKFGKILRLNRALYGLRRSPILWQRTFYASLLEIGFKPVPHEPCCLTYEGILIFFYVDDIVVAYKKSKQPMVHELIKKLQQKYNLEGGQQLQWFLGIRVLRDRERKLIWLSQSTYIDKIANLATSSQPDSTPMSQEELMSYKDRASYSEINSYQRKIGSLLYAAVTTRPDIAFATSRLSRFLTNPGPNHHAAADRVLLYLSRYRNLGLQFGGKDDTFTVASDASFADNTLDRKSSQAYAMKLFGGLIGWRANKQDTVTTSTTEAELLALSQAAKEGQYISRLLRELTVQLDQNRIEIQCDNAQTIRLVTEEIAKLQTKLRHVDIHNHWLRQEVTRNRINVVYTKSKDMIADGLTKVLLAEKFNRFRDQMGLVDIGDKIKDDKDQRDQEEKGDNYSYLFDEVNPRSYERTCII